MSGYPIRRDIVLRGDSACLVYQKEFHRRLESLFNVHVNVSTQQYKDRSVGSELVVDSGASRWVTVRGKSEEDCLKTQRYVLASSKPEVKVLVPCGPQLLKVLFEDNHSIRDKIERDSEVLIVPAPKDGGLYIQGAQSQVSSAVERVHRLADTIHPYPSNTKHTDHTTFNSNKQTTATYNQSKTQQSPPIDTTNFIIRDPNCAPQPPTTTAPAPVTLDTKRINKYVMLGFPVEQVQNVIESLGPHASENDIMSRLNSRNPSTKSSVPPTANVSETLSKEGLRPIVIDGSNVAMKHANGKYFSCKGIEIALKYFRGRGHSEITIFVPEWRKEPSRPETPIKDQEILFQLEKAGYIKCTPSRRFGNRKIVCYDDRFIVQLAYERGGIIVSDDNFRDLFEENKLWQETIEKRVLQFVFVEDCFMVPQDPLGKHGPHLDVFLRFESGISPNRDGGADHQYPIPKDKTPCPYKEKCSFGPRCRYYHPEREIKQREKEVQEDNTSRTNSPSIDWRKEQQQKEDLSKTMNNLSIQYTGPVGAGSPRKIVHSHPHSHMELPSDTPPGGLRRGHQMSHSGPPMSHSGPPMSHSGPPMSHSGPPSMDRDITSLKYSPMPHDVWSGNARPREDHNNVMATMARGGSDRHPPTTAIPYNHSIRPNPHMQPRPHVNPPHILDYHQSHYQHQRPLYGNDRQGYPNNIPSSVRPMNTGYTHYKDPHHRELDQLQSLDHNQKMIYEKAVDNFPHHKDRILALIVQYHISDFNSLLKALS